MWNIGSFESNVSTQLLLVFKLLIFFLWQVREKNSSEFQKLWSNTHWIHCFSQHLVAEEAACLVAVRRQGERGRDEPGPKYTLQRHLQYTLLPLVSLHLPQLHHLIQQFIAIGIHQSSKHWLAHGPIISRNILTEILHMVACWSCPHFSPNGLDNQD